VIWILVDLHDELANDPVCLTPSRPRADKSDGDTQTDNNIGRHAKRLLVHVSRSKVEVINSPKQ
jgi:hypothetical protein